ncbi:MAG: GNAT family N-acetyltransferase [Methylobacteriaceae bacterium]|nr:GNAT family N-acetyltransferase [Methylobacteriaceae bacterium]
MEDRTMFGGVVRRLWPPDAPALRDHLLRLDADSRYDRFAMAVSNEFIIGYAERCFGFDDIIYGFFVDGVLRGAGELRRVAGSDGPSGFANLAEAAFSVERPWRRRGVGAELMARIVRAARNRRAETLYMSCLARNQAMRALARKFSAELRFEPDESSGRLSCAGPTAFSLLYEAMDDAQGFATAMLDLQRRLFTMQRPAR